MQLRRLAIPVVLVIGCLPAAPQKPPSVTTAEQKTARYQESVRNQPSLLLEFMRMMPKGGDLHNHLSGAVYAESYIQFAAKDGLCVDRKSLALVSAREGGSTCDAEKGHVPASAALGDPVLYRDMIDAWSMRNHEISGQPAHDHFFDTFLKFDHATTNHMGEMLAEVVSRAAHGNLVYLELILAADELDPAYRVGAAVGWSGDAAATRQKLLAGGIPRVVANARKAIDEAEAKMRQLLGCGTSQADPGCDMVVRYQYEVHRGLPTEQAYAEMVAGFELASAHPRVLAVNLG